MMHYDLSGALPNAFQKRLLPCIARECCVASATARKHPWSIGLRFVTPKAIQSLNRAYRNKNRPTDVLSFGESDGPKFPKGEPSFELGDIAVCPLIAKRNALERGCTQQEELVRLVIHGTLHLLGLDHAVKREETRMMNLQERILTRIIKV